LICSLCRNAVFSESLRFVLPSAGSQRLPFPVRAPPTPPAYPAHARVPVAGPRRPHADAFPRNYNGPLCIKASLLLWTPVFYAVGFQPDLFHVPSQLAVNVSLIALRIREEPPRPAEHEEMLKSTRINHRCWSIGRRALESSPRRVTYGRRAAKDHWTSLRRRVDTACARMKPAAADPDKQRSSNALGLVPSRQLRRVECWYVEGTGTRLAMPRLLRCRDVDLRDGYLCCDARRKH